MIPQEVYQWITSSSIQENLDLSSIGFCQEALEKVTNFSKELKISTRETLQLYLSNFPMYKCSPSIEKIIDDMGYHYIDYTRSSSYVNLHYAGNNFRILVKRLPLRTDNSSKKTQGEREELSGESTEPKHPNSKKRLKRGKGDEFHKETTEKPLVKSEFPQKEGFQWYFHATLADHREAIMGGIDPTKGRPRTDFCRRGAFYVSPSLEETKDTAEWKIGSMTEKRRMVAAFHIKKSDLDEQIPNKEFPLVKKNVQENQEEWEMLVLAMRKYDLNAESRSVYRKYKDHKWIFGPRMADFTERPLRGFGSQLAVIDLNVADIFTEGLRAIIIYENVEKARWETLPDDHE